MGGAILNFIGATVRWVYGSIWRTLASKPKFGFKEYVYGPKNSDDSFDSLGHQFNNKIIGGLFIGIIVSLFI